MKLFAKKDKRAAIDKEIEAVLEYMKIIKPETEEYTTITSNLKKLYEAKNGIPDRRIKPETIVMIVGTLLEIGLIMGHEKLNIISTKAWSRLTRGRV
jgi:hypothetical protein